MDRYTRNTTTDLKTVKELTMNCQTTMDEIPPEFVRTVMSQWANDFKHKKWFTDIEELVDRTVKYWTDKVTFNNKDVKFKTTLCQDFKEDLKLLNLIINARILFEPHTVSEPPTPIQDYYKAVYDDTGESLPVVRSSGISVGMLWWDSSIAQTSTPIGELPMRGAPIVDGDSLLSGDSSEKEVLGESLIQGSHILERSSFLCRDSPGETQVLGESDNGTQPLGEPEMSIRDQATFELRLALRELKRLEREDKKVQSLVKTLESAVVSATEKLREAELALELRKQEQHNNIKTEIVAMKEMITRTIKKGKFVLKEKIGLDEPKYSSSFKQYSLEETVEILKLATREALDKKEDSSLERDIISQRSKSIYEKEVERMANAKFNEKMVKSLYI